ncbi:MAG: di-heme enzyme, partial [Acidobacteria bacterium]|nr:di-heme enzyme [Acidobacteriota bacterium]
EDVIEHYRAGGRTIETGKYAGVGSKNPNKSSFVRGFELTQQEKGDLVAFLKSLTDKRFVTNPKFSDPWK